MILTRYFLIVVLCYANASSASAQRTAFISAESLPNIQVDGASIKIHTQGLFVTKRDYFVTGRIDTPPRRPVLIRFPRDQTEKYELLDLTVPGKEGVKLNHPGGFDRDANGVFWIPVSTSDRRGPTTIVGITLNDRKLPAKATEITKTFVIDDHLGAICCLDDGRLLAANWDTKTVYLIDSSSGLVVEKIKRESFFVGAGGVHLAVQDWKFDRERKLVIAGGIDKSPNRPSNRSKGVIAWIDPETRAVTSIIRLEARSDVTRPLTNEGMALHAGKLFLLPEDFGKGAKILQFSLPDRT